MANISESTQQIQPLPTDLQKSSTALKPGKSSKGGQGAAPAFSYYSVLFLLLLTTMQGKQKTVLIQSKEISLNASVQEKLNKENGKIKFAVLPPKAGTATINQVNDENEEYSAQREDIQNNLITTRQTGQVEMTQASTNVNSLQEYASEDSGYLKALYTIFKVIDKITGK